VRVAIAHEWLVSFAGSERCVVEMRKEFPGSRLLTTVHNPSMLPAELQYAEASFLNRIPWARRHHTTLVPTMPAVWATRKPINDVDLVISSSHACAKGVRVEKGIPHLCYCHTPMRYAWDFEMEKDRFSAIERPFARAATSALRRWDRNSADRVQTFIANSSTVAERIKLCYGRTARVVYPPVDIDFFTPAPDERSDYFLYVGRLVAYKRPDLVLESFRGLPHRLVIAGTGPMLAKLRHRAPSNVEILGPVDDVQLRALYRGAQALVYPGVEDFGIVMAEAMACGTPVIAAGAGGALDIVDTDSGGILIADPTCESLRRAVAEFHYRKVDHLAVRLSAERFSPSRFRAGIRQVAEETIGRRSQFKIASPVASFAGRVERGQAETPLPGFQ
jgi:glycosyltransferase involved in cell wall biosynthesis